MVIPKSKRRSASGVFGGVSSQNQRQRRSSNQRSQQHTSKTVTQTRLSIVDDVDKDEAQHQGAIKQQEEEEERTDSFPTPNNNESISNVKLNMNNRGNSLFLGQNSNGTSSTRRTQYNDDDDLTNMNMNISLHSTGERTSSSLLWKPRQNPIVRCYKVLPDNFPRLHAICFYIILPLWFLIFMALLGGYLLAGVEYQTEIDANDALLKDQHIQEGLDAKGGMAVNYLLDHLPSKCFESYLQEQNITNTNYTLYDLVLSSSIDKEEVYFTDILQSTSDTISYILERLDVCATELEGIANETDVQEQILLDAIEGEYVSGDLTFDWIRCWNQSEYGDNFWLGATSEQYDAAQNQTEFYIATWEADLQYKTNLYLYDVDNMTIEEVEQAKRRALNDATGGGSCDYNTAGTAWFWFTVMTTVGYGNQSPSTSGGRWMVTVLGFFSILMFGGILITAGQVVLILGDDVVKRKRLKSNASLSVLFWTGINIGWIFAIGSYTNRWWGSLDFDYDFWDSIWFAYISVTTIGLGDFYLQPEVIFLPELFIFTLFFLTGFVFLSTYLDSLAQWLGACLPDVGEKLAKRLSKHRKLKGEDGEVIEDRRSVDALHDLIESLPEGKRSLELIKEENALLRKLLERNSKELSRLLKKNQKERNDLEVEDQHVRGVMMKSSALNRR